VARPKVCGNLNVITPQQVQWKPPLRQAALTLGASGGQRSGNEQETRMLATSNLT